MEYGALAVGVTDELLHQLQTRLAAYDLHFESVPTVREASRQLSRKLFHLLIVDLEYLRSIGQINWLESIRHTSFIPLVILSDTPEDDMSGMVKLGADICVSGKYPYSVVADVVFAQFRRYTAYNHYDNPQGQDNVPFTSGDIYIDPLRREVKVRGREVVLRRREFLLLLYFMKNPGIILSAEQICNNAWDSEGSYAQGVSGPIAILRKAIEPDPAHPIYIKTEKTFGYCFTAHNSETCDICSDFVGFL